MRWVWFVGVGVANICPSPQVAVCNLASIALPRFVRSDKTFDFQKLFEVTKVIQHLHVHVWLL